MLRLSGLQHFPLNHTVLGHPNTTLTNATFGKILSTQTAPRVGEMGLKLLF